MRILIHARANTEEVDLLLRLHRTYRRDVKEDAISDRVRAAIALEWLLRDKLRLEEEDVVDVVVDDE